MSKGKHKRGFEKHRRLLLIFDELQRSLGNDYSKKQLLLTAQLLIEVSDRDYDKKALAEWKERNWTPGHYSMPVDIAMKQFPWLVVIIEEKLYND